MWLSWTSPGPPKLEGLAGASRGFGCSEDLRVSKHRDASCHLASWGSGGLGGCNAISVEVEENSVQIVAGVQGRCTSVSVGRCTVLGEGAWKTRAEP